MRFYLLGLLMCALCMQSVAIANELQFNVPKAHSDKPIDDYALGLLNIALEHQSQPYRIKRSQIVMNQARAVMQMHTSPEHVNFYWMGTGSELEEKLHPVRIPILRGLTGYRVFIIHRHDQTKFASIEGLTQLKRLIGIQGRGWTDVEILESAGLVQMTNNYERIFAVIDQGGRVDYFSRSVTEAQQELEHYQHRYPNLALEQHLLLHYPFAVLFFASDPQLAEAVHKGLTNAYHSGAMDEYFFNSPLVQQALELIDTDQRIHLGVPNPLMTESLKQLPAYYWYRPDRF